MLQSLWHCIVGVVRCGWTGGPLVCDCVCHCAPLTVLVCARARTHAHTHTRTHASTHHTTLFNFLTDWPTFPPDPAPQEGARALDDGGDGATHPTMAQDEEPGVMVTFITVSNHRLQARVVLAHLPAAERAGDSLAGARSMVRALEAAETVQEALAALPYASWKQHLLPSFLPLHQELPLLNQ